MGPSAVALLLAVACAPFVAVDSFAGPAAAVRTVFARARACTHRCQEQRGSRAAASCAALRQRESLCLAAVWRRRVRTSARGRRRACAHGCQRVCFHSALQGDALRQHICARVGGARKLTRAVQTQLRQSTGPATSGRGPIAGAGVCALFPAARQCRWMLRKASGRAGSGVRRARGGEPGIAGGLRMSLSEGERDSLWDQIEDLQEKMQTAVDQVARESVCACAHARSA